ncbi:hypothetical protein Ddye_027433 [Dipteronia dyeriana]|uniref:Homeobox domain-containing protein n=1 Tax=Dipteronia dyeriana TaxID=168575 RepID=A0AAD9TPW7_9ROSI|nr:hypothetical protein Ddye_027433 [Dipteronia dyeriana]
MIPARNMQSMIGWNGNVGGFGSSSSSGLTPSQPNMLEGQLQPLDMTQNTLSESKIVRLIQEFDSTKSGNKNHEGTFDFDQDQQSPKKRPYRCHTQHQIQEMESFFKECPHPEDKQSEELSRELGLEPLQVKFWFQNKRAQMKHENTKLRMENKKLRADNIRYRGALGNPSCPNCGGPTAVGKLTFDEHHLILENAFLREELLLAVVRVVRLFCACFFLFSCSCLVLAALGLCFDCFPVEVFPCLPFGSNKNIIQKKSRTNNFIAPIREGTGGVLRNCSGAVLCLFSVFVGYQDSITAELMANRACSLCASNPSMQGLIIEIVSDSLVVVTWINADSIGSYAHVKLVYNIQDLLRVHGRMLVRFCSRNSNSYADNLAKKGSNMEGELCNGVVRDLGGFICSLLG